MPRWPLSPATSRVEPFRDAISDIAGEMVLKCENGPMGAAGVPFEVVGGALTGTAASSSPAINLVSRPSIHEPIVSSPALFPGLRPAKAFAGLADGVPVNRSFRSSRLDIIRADTAPVAIFPVFDAASTALQYLKEVSAGLSAPRMRLTAGQPRHRQPRQRPRPSATCSAVAEVGQGKGFLDPSVSASSCERIPQSRQR